MTTAVVLVPPTDYAPHADTCLDHCREQGYEFVGLVQSWLAALRALVNGSAQVVVVARREHIDISWTPAVEVVSEYRVTREMPSVVSQNRGGHQRVRRPKLIVRD